jgi:hypothetical protein
MVKILLRRHKNCSYIPWTLCSWKIALSLVETLRHVILLLCSKFIRKDVLSWKKDNQGGYDTVRNKP